MCILPTIIYFLTALNYKLYGWYVVDAPAATQVCWFTEAG